MVYTIYITITTHQLYRLLYRRCKKIMKKEIKQQIINSMKSYDEEDLDLYKAEAGWEGWMNDYTDADDGEECSERELDEINKIQDEMWAEAHS